MFEHDGFSYCLAQDLYTEVEADDEICDGAELMVYTCKDCFFYKNDVCKVDAVERYTADFSEACRSFEYKREFEN